MSQNLHNTQLGWYVWLENKINEWQMMGKSLFYIAIVSLSTIMIAVMITTKLGLYHSNLSLSFYGDFLRLSFKAIFNDELHRLWFESVWSIFSDISRMLIFHSIFGILIGRQMYKTISEKSKKLGDTEFISGTKLISETMRLKEVAELVKKGAMKYRFSICRIPLPYDVESNSFLGIAASGGGKGVLLSRIMQKISKLNNVRGISFDPKPEWTMKCYRPERGDMIFNPVDARSIKYTISNDFEDPIDIKTFCHIVIPHNPEAKDNFWDDSARGILEGIVSKLWEKDQCTNENIKLIMSLSGKDISEFLVGHVGSEYAQKDDSVRTLRSKMTWLDFMPDGDFCVRDWVRKSKNGLIFLTSTEKTAALFEPALTLFVNTVASQVLALPIDRNRRFFFLLDEFTSLRKLEKIIPLLKLGRDRGSSVWLFFQDMQAAIQLYSKDSFATIVNNCKNFACGQTLEPDAAEYFSKRFGKQVFYEKADSKSWGVGENRDGSSFQNQRKEEYVVKAGDLQNLPEREFYVKINGFEGVTRSTADIINMPTIAEGFVPLEMSKADWIKLMNMGNKAKEARVLMMKDVELRNDKKDSKIEEHDKYEEIQIDENEFSY